MRTPLPPCPWWGTCLNTLIFSLITTAVMVVVSTLAAYAFARLRFRGKNLVFGLFLSMMMIPTELVVITNFVTITNLDLRNSFLGLILPSITSVFYIYLLKENFEQVPEELYKAAKVDGTSDLKYLWKVMIPICRPTLVTIAILKLIECWNCYVWPRLITDDPAYYLVIQRHPGDPGKRLWPGEHPRHDGRRCGGHQRAADPAVFGLPEEDHGGRVARRDKGMKQFLSLLLAAGPVAVPLWQAATAAGSSAAFTVPAPVGRHLRGTYEITFWAKNDTNMAPDRHLQAGHRRFSGAVPQHHRESAAVHRLRGHL